MATKIDKLRYFKCGYAAPKNSSFSGKMTSEAFTGYYDYTSREEAQDDMKELEQKKDGYIGYTSSHHEGYTRSSEGVLDTEEKKKQFKKEIAKYFKNDGDLAWENVLSISDFEIAQKYGLYKIEDWEAVLSKALPQFFKYAGYDNDNMIWWWDYHVNKSHPHIHIVWLEKNKTKTEGYLPPRYLKALKRFTAKELIARYNICNRIDTQCDMIFKEKDFKFNEILVNVDKYLLSHQNANIKDLYRVLPRTGRLQYNSYQMKDYKKLIDKVIENIINEDEDIKAAYNEWMRNIDVLANNMNDIQNSQIETFKKAELDKLYTRIGNKILRMYKEKPVEIGSKTKNQNHKKYMKSSRFSTSATNKILGVYCLNLIYQQNAEMEQSLREFLRINNLESDYEI